MPNYQNGKIYKLWSPQGDEIYIGSTTETLARRKSGHKSLNCSSKILFEKYDDVRIELIEEYPCKNKMELDRQEGEHIRNNICINRCVAGRTNKEWVEDNKDILKEKQKLYREENKEQIKQQRHSHYEKNKEDLLEKQKEYQKLNKEKINEYHKEWYEKNKEKINENRLQKITCECGCEISINHIARHKRSKKHIEFIQQHQQVQE